MSDEQKHDDGGMACNKTLLDEIAIRAMEGMLHGCVGSFDNVKEPSAYRAGHCNHAIVDRAFVLAADMIAEKRKREMQ